jgi:hypothetical protein
MLTSRRFSVALVAFAVFLLALLGLVVAASAAPITVRMRIEGSSATLYEGPVTTSGQTIETPSSGGPHPCNFSSNGPPGGFADEGTPSGTPTTALHDAALAGGFAFDAKWFGSGPGNTGDPGDFFVTKLGTDENGGPPTFPSWGFAVNYTTAVVGGCQIALAPGSEVLWAYNYFNLTHLLDLSAPASAGSGAPFTVHVVDGRTGEPIAGAAIGESAAGVTTTLPGSSLTDASGNATISLPAAGTVTLKATQPESVRSNGLVVCVHAGNDGSCGTTVAGSGSAASPGAVNSTPPVATAVVARILGIVNGRDYSSGSAPRILRGSVKVAAGGSLRQVRIRLQRRVGRRCLNFSGARGRFVPSRKCSAATFFSVGSSESFSYLLPTRLPPGRYTYDIEALEVSGNVTRLVGGVSHVVFRVK